MVPRFSRRHEDMALVFTVGVIVGAILLAIAMPHDAWEMAWRFRGPSA